MARGLFWAVLGLATLGQETTALAGDLPINVIVPGECILADKGANTWACDYTKFESTGLRDRRILISIQEIPLDPEVLTYLGTLAPAEIGALFEYEIMGIDTRRKASLPVGRYEESYNRFLDERECPEGPGACARSMDAMTTDGSIVKTTRSHLHCLMFDAEAGAAIQKLVSLLEYNSIIRPASPTLDTDFEAIVASISLRRQVPRRGGTRRVPQAHQGG